MLSIEDREFVQQWFSRTTRDTEPHAWQGPLLRGGAFNAGKKLRRRDQEPPKKSDKAARRMIRTLKLKKRK